MLPRRIYFRPAVDGTYGRVRLVDSHFGRNGEAFTDNQITHSTDAPARVTITHDGALYDYFVRCPLENRPRSPDL